MKELFSLRTVRKKILMLSKLAGLALIFSYVLSTGLPISEDASFLLWLGFVLLLVLGIDFFMGRFITKPIDKLNASAKRMAGLDFSAPCNLVSTDEFGELSASLNTMAENLQQALVRLEDANTQLEKDVEKERLLLAERKELVDSLSHEMKTPLGIIRAYAEGLQDETDFVELVETVAGRLLVDTPDAGFDLQYVLPEQKCFVETDRRRMEQVLENFMVNARKNVSPGGILWLEVTADDGTLHFSIFNQGRTIPENDLPKIWTKFYRDSNAGYSGSGLGLSIVAQILSMQNLPYGAENRVDGVLFWFSIPVTE